MGAGAENTIKEEHTMEGAAVTTTTYVFAGIATAHYAAALPWYERLFGRPPDLLPQDEEAAWRLTDTGWIYLVGDAARAGKALLTILVDDLDAQVAALAERGLAPNELETLSDGGRKAAFVDPEGNKITFAQPGSTED
jgi:predicted enzyme related to lactoylglutathione lyase